MNRFSRLALLLVLVVVAGCRCPAPEQADVTRLRVYAD